MAIPDGWRTSADTGILDSRSASFYRDGKKIAEASNDETFGMFYLGPSTNRETVEIGSVFELCAKLAIDDIPVPHLELLQWLEG